MEKQSLRKTVDGVLDQFCGAAEGMFEVTSRYHKMYEQGLYGCVTAKPSHRMRASLGVDREVLAVVSTFANQQQRTIKFVEYEIDQSQGRYESSIAIIVHSDPDGDVKLKHWGREKGISVLPVSIERLTRCIQEERRNGHNALEKILCVELYSHDPFDVTGPVSDDQNFFGRREEAIDLARKLQKGQIRACLGMRKVGKTSIINRVLREIDGSHDCTTVMIDCSRDEVSSMTAPQLLAAMSRAVEESSGDYIVLTSVKAHIEIGEACSTLRAGVLRCERPLLFVFDEVDYISPGSPTEKRWRTDFNVFWRNLRSVLQESTRRGLPISILVSGVSSYWFSVESIDGIENAAVAFIPEEYLSPMPERATVAMLRRLGGVAGLRFTEAAARAVAQSTGNMPYWARKCCSYIHRQVPVSDRPCELTDDSIAPLIEAFVTEEGVAIAELALRHLFRVHPRLEKAAMQCHEGKNTSVPEVLKSALRRYGILTARNRIEGVMTRKALAALGAAQLNRREEEEAGGSESAPEMAAGSLREWAEELATLGSRRNILERRLRALLLNFIRFDSLGNGTQNLNIRQRVLRAVSERRRKQLEHLSAEDIISRFTWNELTEVMGGREWPLFERIFGDKRKFREMSDLVNDRFDAHAKEVDLADVALHRRALGYLEERIERIE